MGWGRRSGAVAVLGEGPVDEAALGPGPALRRGLLAAAVVVVLVAVTPPLLTASGSYAVWQALDFCLLATVAPVLLVLAAPWSLWRQREPRADGTLVERAAFVRLRHRGQLRSFLFVIPAIVVIVGWRLPVSVDAVVDHRYLVALEAVTLVPAGALAWLECLGAPPLQPRSPRPRRIVLAALPMWTTWIMAFMLGFSRSEWFRAFHHHAGHGLSMIADQQFTAGVLWFIPFWVFIPYELANIIRWLRGGEDPDMELGLLLRSERRGGGFLP